MTVKKSMIWNTCGSCPLCRSEDKTVYSTFRYTTHATFTYHCRDESLFVVTDTNDHFTLLACVQGDEWPLTRKKCWMLQYQWCLPWMREKKEVQENSCFLLRHQEKIQLAEMNFISPTMSHWLRQNILCTKIIATFMYSIILYSQN